MDIRNIIGEVVREMLPEVVREVLRGELGVADSGARTRHSLPVQKLKRPSAAEENGVKVGQRWKAKSYSASAGRVIEIMNLGKDKVLPKVINSNGKRGVAKPISYAMLSKAYELVK